MRRAMLFAARFFLGLWGVLFASFCLMLWLNTPVAIDAPFSSVSIDAQPAVYLPTRIFECTENSQQFNCQATVSRRVLDFTWQKRSGYQSDFDSLESCIATYDGKSVACDNKGASSVIGLPDRYEISGLELSPSELQSVRRRYWGADTLATIGEPRLQSIGNYIALLGGVSVACFVWFHTRFASGFFVSLSCGFLACLLSLVLLPFQDPLSPAHWILPTRDWSIFIGLAVFLMALFFSWRAARQSTVPSKISKTMVSLFSGGGVAAAVSVFFFVMTLTLWYAD